MAARSHQLAGALAVAIPTLCSAQCQPEWSSVGGGANVSFSALAVHDEDGDGPKKPALFLGSGQGTFAGVEFRLMAGWDGWKASFFDGMAGIGIEGFGHIAAPVGSLPAGLYPLGSFEQTGGVSVHNIARWNSPDWQDVSGGLTFDPPQTLVITRCFMVFDEDAEGPLPPCLFVGGRFNLAGGVPVNGIARWDGTNWSEVGGSLGTGMQNTWPSVHAFAVFDDGRGPALYAGGSFKYAAGKLAWNIARWDGQDWETLEPGLNATVETLCVYDEDGDGPKKPALFAGGQFNAEIGHQGHLWGVARWDGKAWTEVGGWRSSGAPQCMTVWKGPDDDRENLYMGGMFNVLPTGKAIRSIARWDGQTWREVDYGLDGYGAGTSVDAMAPFDEDGDGPNPGGLYVGGLFYYAGTKGVESHFIARWGCPLGPRCEADLDRSGALDLFDFLAFVNLFNSEDPTADCDASGSLDLFDFLCFTNAFNAGC